MFFKVHSCYVLWSLQFIKWLCLLITLIALIRPNHFDWFNISQPKRVCQQARRQRHQPNNDIRCPLKSFHISGWNIFTHLCKYTHHPLPHVIRFHRPRTRKWHAVVEECEPKCRETKCSQTSRLRDISQPVCVFQTLRLNEVCEVHVVCIKATLSRDSPSSNSPFPDSARQCLAQNFDDFPMLADAPSRSFWCRLRRRRSYMEMTMFCNIWLSLRRRCHFIITQRALRTLSCSHLIWHTGSSRQ